MFRPRPRARGSVRSPGYGTRRRTHPQGKPCLSAGHREPSQGNNKLRISKPGSSGASHRRRVRPRQRSAPDNAAVRCRYSPGHRENYDRAGACEKANTELLLAADTGSYCCHQAAASRGRVCAHGHVAPGQRPHAGKSPPTQVPACTETSGHEGLSRKRARTAAFNLPRGTKAPGAVPSPGGNQSGSAAFHEATDTSWPPAPEVLLKGKPRSYQRQQLVLRCSRGLDGGCKFFGSHSRGKTSALHHSSCN